MKTKIYIFGAHSRAQTLTAYFRILHPEIEIAAYLYDNDEANPQKIGDTQVLSLDNMDILYMDYPVYISVRGVHHQQIISHLRQIGFKEIYPVTVEMDRELRNKYMEKYFAGIGQKFIKIDDLETNEKVRAAVYVAMSELDKPLKTVYTLASYEKPIQTGAALTSKRLAEGIQTDDTGKNISDKNRQFCELTALYWIWKHVEDEIVGLVQYRRHFILPEDWVARMQENEIDVILPVPLYVAPNLAENFKSRHDPSDWDFMMKYLKKRNRQEYEEAKHFFGKNLFCPCNMFIMRREVMNELCEWLFPILFAVAEHGGQKEDGYLNRYPGFISERLVTFFFEKNRGRYRVVYADKNFLH